jgi:hypothetical protein
MAIVLLNNINRSVFIVERGVFFLVWTEILNIVYFSVNF